MSGRACHQRQLWRSLALVLIVAVAAVHGEIHRAKAANSRPYYAGRAAHARLKPGSHISTFDEDYVNVTNCEEDVKDWMCNLISQDGRSHIWILSLVSAAIVGLSGVFPLLLIPLQFGEALTRGGEANNRLKLLLSFAVGGLLGDVFLHLLPEAWAHLDKLGGTHDGNLSVGCWVLTGLLIFMFIEKLFPENENNEECNSKRAELMQPVEITTRNQQSNKCNGTAARRPAGNTQKCASKNTHGLVNIIDGITHSSGIGEYSCSSIINGYVKSVVCAGDSDKKMILTQRQLNDENVGVHKQDDCNVSTTNNNAASPQHIKTSGWLNLMANVIDNFTHGLAVAGSFSVGVRTGFITLFAILLHEIPHEVGDFAILLRSGFDRWTAAKAQLLTATGGILGALAALTAESAQSAGDQTAWILPFTCGGFIYIAMVTVLPDLLRETNPMQSLKQFVMVCSGIAVMGAVTLLSE